jgi:signal recognition particle subunit SEC65
MSAAIDDVDNMDFALPTDDQVLAQINNQFSAGGAAIDLEHFKRAITLYPVYFDRCKTVAQGRRLSRQLAVPTNPCSLTADEQGIPLTCWHLAAACQQLQLQCLVEERKRYPRNHFAYGRVRVILNNTTITTSTFR